MNSALLDSQAFARGLLLGDDSGLSLEAKELFRQAGIQHLTAASGANLALVGLFARPFQRRWRWFGESLLLAVYLAYWQATGGSSSLWRATVLAIVVLLANFSGRKLSFFHGLLFSIFFTFLIGSEYFRKIGFWLSVAACLGLIFSQNIIPGENKRDVLSQSNRTAFRLFRVLAASTYVTLFVTPVVWYFFGESSMVGAFMTPIASLFVLPIQVFGLLVFGFGDFLKPFIALPQYCLLWLYVIFIDLLRLFISLSQTFAFALISGAWFLLCFCFSFRVGIQQLQRHRRTKWAYWFRI